MPLDSIKRLLRDARRILDPNYDPDLLRLEGLGRPIDDRRDPEPVVRREYHPVPGEDQRGSHDVPEQAARDHLIEPGRPRSSPGAR